MRGKCAPKDPAIEELVNCHLSPRGVRQTSPILGLSVVSGLNIACLAFITYHFVTHPQDPMGLPVEHSAASEASDVEAQPPTPATVRVPPDFPGNVDLVPAAKNVISIASGLPMLDRKLTDRRENLSTTFALSHDSAEAKASNYREALGHWVQLGALSKKNTALRYWSRLKLRHKSLLQNREPRYFGPAEINGSLYHVRLGPMAGEAAAKLCKKLEAEGADCFCISPYSSRN